MPQPCPAPSFYLRRQRPRLAPAMAGAIVASNITIIITPLPRVTGNTRTTMPAQRSPQALSGLRQVPSCSAQRASPPTQARPQLLLFRPPLTRDGSMVQGRTARGALSAPCTTSMATVFNGARARHHSGHSPSRNGAFLQRPHRMRNPDRPWRDCGHPALYWQIR